MSFDKINLPDFLIADLYKSSLVVLDRELKAGEKPNENNPAKPSPKPAAKKITTEVPVITGNNLSYLGNNEKRVAIVVSDETTTHLQDESLEILTNILTACKLNLADVAIINMSKQVVSHELLRKHLMPKTVLLFGVETTAIDLPFSIPPYKVQEFDGCSYVQSLSLTKMSGNGTEARLEKSKLWICLKNLFEI